MPVIFVTGATSGFGAATARLFAKNGWKVVATGRRQERLDALAAEFPGLVHPARLDLTDKASVEAAVAALPADFQPIMCLFNNGGLALGSNPIPNTRFEDWERMIDTNIKGLLYATMAVLPLLKAAGKGASIVNVGSIAGRLAYPGGNVYGATKAFVHNFSENLRTDLGGGDIRVTGLEPGMAKSEFTTVRTYGDAEANEKFYEGVEPILPENIADMVWFIANQPPHININFLEVMCTAQIPARTNIVRKS
ncbi:SDR family NAD(P)-dependent oxidoreductase [Devosia sp.]|jgi:NADP-dependent 3-hydroxy acid dehydrogenase YdfG|uniref:SDR family NAD(P)-dependent oxidoreductase n=1 Tax=Devosia sp. TaxID=1871048 RepID=UPI0037C16586